MTPVNYKSDFALLLRLYLCKSGDEGAPAEKGVEIDFPTYDWEARFWTWNKANVYTASCKGGVCTNCRNEGGKILVVFNGHGLSPGTLNVEFTALLPDDLFPDGDRRTVVPGPLGVVLTKDAACCPSTMEAEMILPYIKGDKGDAFTYDDFTAQDKADLIAPMRDDLEQFAAGKADVSQLSNILGHKTDAELEEIEPNLVTDALRKTPQSLTPAEQAQVKANIGIVETKVFNDLLRKMGVKINDDGTYRLNGLTLTYDEMLAVYNAGRPGSAYDSLYFGAAIRTHLPPKSLMGTQKGNRTFQNSSVEVASLNLLMPGESCFAGCSKLRSVTVYSINNQSNSTIFQACAELVTINQYGDTYGNNIYLGDCPKLSLASWQSIVNKYHGTKGFTITVHPDVYAKLTDAENYPDWAAVTELAATKNIIFAT